LEISKPIYLLQKNHAGWNPETQTFNYKEIPSDIKALLRRAGIKKKLLKNKEFSFGIYDIIQKGLESNLLLTKIAEDQDDQTLMKV
jgi:hypothetical protein